MAIATINEMVHERLSYLNNTTDDVLINSWIIQQFYFMQGQTEKSDVDVENENAYKPLERMFFGALVSYKMLLKRITDNMAGTNGSTVVTPGKVLKLAKADVVEAEFEVPKAADGIFLGLSADELLSKLADEVCSIAYMLNYYIPQICDEPVITIIPAFKVYPQDCY